VFTSRYALSPYIKRTSFVFKSLAHQISITGGTLKVQKRKTERPLPYKYMQEACETLGYHGVTVKKITVLWYVAHLEKRNAFIFYPEI
jgi:hypothetical protein